MPVTSLIMVRFSIHKKFWKALDLLYQITVEMTGNNGGNDRNDGGNDGNNGRNDRNDRNEGGNHLKMTNLWMPVTSLIMVRFSIRKKFWKALDLLYQMIVETIGNDGGNDGNDGRNDGNDGGNHGLVSCWILDWKFVSMVSPKWHHGMVSFSRWKPWTLTLKSCDYSFWPIRRLHSVKSHTSLEKLWDFHAKRISI